MTFADLEDLKKSGRNYICKGCPKKVQKLRRCREDRDDFTSKDGSVFPMQVHPGGTEFGFCPAKATWDTEVKSVLGLLVVAAETGVMLEPGGLGDQPKWWVDILSWFLPAYDKAKFLNRVRMVVGDGKPKTGGGKQPPPSALPAR